MGVESTRVRDQLVPFTPNVVNGLPSIPGGGPNFGLGEAVYFDIVTGSTPGDYNIAALGDILRTDTTRTLLSDAKVPRGCRCYVQDLSIQVNGPTAWTTGTSLNIQDSAGNILAGLPLPALIGYGRYSFRDSFTVFPFTTTVTGSASTTVKTNVSDTYVAKATASLVGSYVTAATGTAANLGLTRQITDHDTTSFTVGTAWPVAPAASDTFFMWGLQGKATMGATTITPQQTGSFGTSAAIDLSVSVISGTGLGQSRRVSANTNAVVFTTDTYGTAPDTSSIFMVSNAPQLNGAFDFYNTVAPLAALAQGKGLQAAVIGTMGAGSPIRVAMRGFFAP